jgi:RNA recognition motif-containing protein
MHRDAPPAGRVRRRPIASISTRTNPRFFGRFAQDWAATLWSSVMGKKLYVGNLGYGVTDSELQEMFQAHGSVQSAQIIMDRDTGRSKGFGFVEMGSDQEAQAAIAALNGKETGGRALTVNEARPKAEGGRGGGGGRRY